MKLGISSWTYPWAVGVPGYGRPDAPLDAFGLLERAAALGVPVVQIADNLPADALSPAELARLLEAARRAGIAIELGTRGVEPPRLARYLEIARCLEARLVRTVPAAADASLAGIEAALREVLPAYEAAGVVLALENYERHTTADLLGLVAAVASPSLGICLDTVNSLGALESPEDVTARLAPHTVNLHIKDFGIERVPSRMGFLVSGRPAGAGLLDIPRLLAAIENNGRAATAIVEQWPPYCGDLAGTIAQEAAWAEQSVRYLRQFNHR